MAKHKGKGRKAGLAHWAPGGLFSVQDTGTGKPGLALSPSERGQEKAWSSLRRKRTFGKEAQGVISQMSRGFRGKGENQASKR